MFANTSTIIGTLYFLPKKIVINGLKSLYPSVLFDKKNKNNNKKKRIYLTIDDISYGNHKEIFIVLKKYDAYGTFFVISDFIEKSQDNREFLINAIKEGYHLANNGKDDKCHILKSNGELGHDIWRCNNIIEDLYRHANKPLPAQKFYRPGCGLFNSKMIRISENNDHLLTLGSLYPWDPYIPIPWLNYLYIIWKIEDGDIIIIHDRWWTVKLLQYLLPWFHKNNFECLSLIDT